MLRIRKLERKGAAILAISGRIQEEHVSELQNLLQAEATARGITLDLGEITLADRETVRFLAACKTRGITLKNCPSYIREWIRLAGG
jgi:anti-anti-sigma regulatory factor